MSDDLNDLRAEFGVAANEPTGMEAEFRAAAEARRAQIIAQTDPVRTREANAIGRQRGIPPSLVEDNIVEFRRQNVVDRNKALAAGNPGVARWSADARNAAAIADDYEAIGKISSALRSKVERDAGDFAKDSGFLDRMGDLFTSALYGMESGAASVKGALQDWSARNPLPWTSAENQQQQARNAAQARAEARVYGRLSQPVAGETTTAQIKKAPGVGNVASFVAEQSVRSVPAMVQAATMLPAFVLGQAGSIGQQRAQNDGRADATISDVSAAAPAAILSAAVERFGIGKLLSPAGGSVARRIASSAATEAGTEFIQSGIEYAGGSVGTKAGFDPAMALEQGAFGALAGAGMGGTFRATGEAGGFAARKVFQRFGKADAALNGAASLDAVMDAAAMSKLRTDDPASFKTLMDELARDSGFDEVFVPAETMQAYMQSDAYGGEFDPWRDQIDEGLLTGGDVAIPMSDMVTGLSGTPAWEAVKDDVRTQMGGETRREAMAFDEAMADVMADLSDRMASEEKAAKDAAAPRDKLVQSVADKLMNAGYVPTQARQLAEYMAQVAGTRASRMGQELTGAEYDALDIQAVMPQAIAQVQKVDQTDILIDVMKKNVDPTKASGPSLMEFIAKNGGVEDKGGDLKSMGADAWHKGKPGKRRLIRDTSGEGQASMLEGGLGVNEYGPDAWALRAWEAGYFPDFAERPTANDLIDAIGEGVAGRERYTQARDKTLRDAAMELRALLENRQIDPDTASKADIRAALDQYQAEQQGGYDQGSRGRILFDDARAVIQLFETRDQSTFLHEAGHLFLEQMRADAMEDDAPQSVKDDWATVSQWFADNGHAIGEDGTIPVEAHELWARGHERYLMEGKSPAPSVRSLFQTFAAWLKGIYRTVDRLNTPITDEVRAVMDRMIATDEELAAAHEAQALEGTFAQKPDTMTDGEWEAYRKLTNDARGLAHDTLLAKVMNAVRRRVTKEYKAQAQAIREEATARVDSLPEFRAIRMMTDTPIDAAWLRDTYGEDATSLFPKRVRPLYKDGGTDPNEVAELSGFTSADEMVRTLMGVETRRREMREGGDKRSVREALIEQEVTERMNDRYGDPLTDGSIEEEALAAVHNELQGEVLAADLRVIARSTGQRPTPYRVAKEWAARTVRQGLVKDVISRGAIQRYRRAAAKAGNLATEALLKGDSQEAFRQKQAQMLNNALVSEAQRMAEAVDKAVERLGKVASKRTIKSVDQDYLERAQALLEQVSLKARSQTYLDRQASFEKWATEQNAAGHDMVVPTSFATTIGTTNWTRLPAEQLIALDEAVAQIIHLGRFKQKLLDAKEERDFEEVVGEAERQIDGLVESGDLVAKPETRTFLEPGFFSKSKSFVLSGDAALLKMESVFDWLDGSTFGVFKRVVFQRFVDAQERRRRMTVAITDELDAAFKAVPKAIRDRWGDKMTLDFIDPRSGKTAVMTRYQVICMALNMGNDGNANKLAGGFNWDQDGILAMLNRVLQPEEWSYVQNVWDALDTLWPEISALERRVNGFAPEKVEARPLQTNAGILKGGYYPVVYDGSRSLKVEKQNDISAEGLFSSAFVRSNTRAGSTNERTEVQNLPILLTPAVISRHVQEVIHDITHREAVMDAHRFLNDPRIVDKVRYVLGEEAQKQFNPWLQHIANEFAYDQQGAGAIENGLRTIRTNATFVGLAYRLSTVMLQLTGFVQTAEVVGTTHMAKGVYAFAKSPVETFRFVLENSQEVAGRMTTMDRDMKEMLNTQSRLGKSVSAIKANGFWMIGIMDRFVSVVSWIGAYNKAQTRGDSEYAAIAYADEVIRMSQGSGSAKDLAAIMRGKGIAGEAAKMVTPFYSYMSAYFQRQRKHARDTGKAFRTGDLRAFPGLISRALLIYIIPVLATEWLNDRLPDEDDDESWTQWALQAVGLNALGPIPVVRDLANASVKSFGSDISSVDRATSTISRSIADAKKMWGDDETARSVRNAFETAGYLGAPTSGQMGATTQFLVDVYNDDQQPENFGDWWEGLTKGKIKE